MTAKERRDNGYDKDAPARPIERKYIFDENYGKQSILNFATGADITE